MERRIFLKGTAAIGAASLTQWNIPFVQAKQVSKSDKAEIITLSDGNLRLPLSFMFPDVPKEEVLGILGPDVVEKEFVEPALNLTLLRDGDRTVLFDVGSGPNFMPTAGKLQDSFDAAGIGIEEITDVVFTHGHPDHLWGILDDFDEVIFTETKLHFPRKEYEFWMDEGTVNKMPEARQSFAVGAKNRLEAMEEQIVLFDPGKEKEVVGGIETVVSEGHTPGHTSYVIHTTGEPIMVLGDSLTNHTVSFQKPDWPSGSDHDPQTGIKTRMALLDRLSTDKMRFIGYHLPNEGIGRAEKSGTTYRFIEA